MIATAKKASLAGTTHHSAKVNGTELHYVETGTEGPPILLVHGFPETWWTFRKIIPLLATSHRVFAVDLRGFGDSDNGPGVYDSKTSAEDLHQLVEELNVGPVHLAGQDISGATGVPGTLEFLPPPGSPGCSSPVASASSLDNSPFRL